MLGSFPYTFSVCNGFHLPLEPGIDAPTTSEGRAFCEAHSRWLRYHDGDVLLQSYRNRLFCFAVHLAGTHEMKIELPTDEDSAELILTVSSSGAVDRPTHFIRGWKAGPKG